MRVRACVRACVFGRTRVREIKKVRRITYSPTGKKNNRLLPRDSSPGKNEGQKTEDKRQGEWEYLLPCVDTSTGREILCNYSNCHSNYEPDRMHRRIFTSLGSSHACHTRTLENAKQENQINKNTTHRKLQHSTSKFKFFLWRNCRVDG